MSKNTNGKVVVRKGLIINRKRNRTVNQDVAVSHPKWENVGRGVLQLKSNRCTFISYSGSKHASLKKKDADVRLAVKDDVVEDELMSAAAE